MNLTEFKSELKLVTTDEWGDAMEAWFECAGHLYKRLEDIPNKWQYKPAPGDPSNAVEIDSYWYELFEGSTTDQLTAIGNFLFNYCQLLEMAGKSY